MPINQYERKTSDIHISDQFKDVLEIFKDRSEVAKLLLYKRLTKEVLKDDHVNYIGVSKNDPTKISYLPLDRIEKIEQSSDEDVWTTSKRIACKPGAFIGKILKDISAKEVENFATLYKTFSEEKDVKFQVVTGMEIKKYYNQDTYFKQTGTLGSSCMKGEGCQDFFKIYIKNPMVSMLLMLSSDDMLIGRALLWTIGEEKVMDRIYTVSDEEYLNYMTKWAVDNGYIHRTYQNWANSIEFTDGKTEFEKKIDIQLEEWNFTQFPYLDTFKWLDMNTGMLSNYRPDHFKDDTCDSTQRTLCVACGTYEYGDYLRFDDLERDFDNRSDIVQVISPMGLNRDIWTTQSNCRWSDTLDSWILKRESSYSDELEDYIYTEKDRNPKDMVKKRLAFVRKSRGKSEDFVLKDWLETWLKTN